MQKIALFPGSFDPFTKGHETIVLKALQIFDSIVIGIGTNTSKKCLFPIEKRIQHIQGIFKGNEKVSVIVYEGLTVNYCSENKIHHLIRGLRNTQDFEYETSIAHVNNSLTQIETVFFLTELKYSALNSSIVREIFKSKGSIDSFVTHAELLV